ncbi:hypothetical protein DPMN_114336 [Dreissena polymorpha]|uniref:Uncharacterized protein n=1 Tax=Dreissena polymorpha TaxID=45954 RepID=A0A9D4KJ87_DREPO|nr:hypothetical protein DPMN_114336 [Dreissena polymorpha]
MQALSIDGRQEGFLWANLCCHVPDVLVGLVLHVGDAEQSSEKLVVIGLYPAFCARVKCPDFRAVQ